jgi:hypothetical protein
MLGVMSLMEIILSKPKKFQSTIFYYNIFSRVLFVIFFLLAPTRATHLQDLFCHNFFSCFVLLFRGFPFFFPLCQWHPYLQFCLGYFPCFWSFCFLVSFCGGCLFNPTNVSLGLCFIYLLGLSSLLNFIALLMTLGSLVSLLALLPFFVGGFNLVCSTYKCDLKVKGCRIHFWYLFPKAPSLFRCPPFF